MYSALLTKSIVLILLVLTPSYHFSDDWSKIHKAMGVTQVVLNSFHILKLQWANKHGFNDDMRNHHQAIVNKMDRAQFDIHDAGATIRLWEQGRTASDLSISLGDYPKDLLTMRDEAIRLQGYWEAGFKDYNTAKAYERKLPLLRKLQFGFGLFSMAVTLDNIVRCAGWTQTRDLSACVQTGFDVVEGVMHLWGAQYGPAMMVFRSILLLLHYTFDIVVLVPQVPHSTGAGRLLLPQTSKLGLSDAKRFETELRDILSANKMEKDEEESLHQLLSSEIMSALKNGTIDTFPISYDAVFGRIQKGRFANGMEFILKYVPK